MRSEQRVECSLLILKPDLLEKGLTAEVEHALGMEELKVIRRQEISMDLDFIQKFYRWNDSYLVELESYLCAEPLPVWLVQGKAAISRLHALKIQFRKKFGTDRLRTLLHCPDSMRDFQRECPLLFGHRRP